MEIYLGRYIPIYTGASPVSNLLIYLVKDTHSKYILEGIYFPRYMPIYAGALKGVLAAASRDMVAFGTALALTHHTPHTTHHTPHTTQRAMHTAQCAMLCIRSVHCIGEFNAYYIPIYFGTTQRGGSQGTAHCNSLL